MTPPTITRIAKISRIRGGWLASAVIVHETHGTVCKSSQHRAIELAEAGLRQNIEQARAQLKVRGFEHIHRDVKPGNFAFKELAKLMKGARYVR